MSTGGQLKREGLTLSWCHSRGVSKLLHDPTDLSNLWSYRLVLSGTQRRKYQQICFGFFEENYLRSRFILQEVCQRRFCLLKKVVKPKIVADSSLRQAAFEPSKSFVSSRMGASQLRHYVVPHFQPDKDPSYPASGGYERAGGHSGGPGKIYGTLRCCCLTKKELQTNR